MSLCEGRVALVTGAGRGMGRAYALMLAQHGAKVVVNDRGTERDGTGKSTSPAEEVVELIQRGGGEASANSADVTAWKDTEAMIAGTVERFGRLDVLVNNAGILRDRMIVNLTESDWDSVIDVHLKGTFLPLRHAAVYWRSQAKEGRPIDARVINTTSHSGLYSNVGQANYAAAKAGIASMTVVAARELQRYGVTVNAICPRANTRLTEGLAKWTPEQIDKRDPTWAASLVTWLSSAESRQVSGRVFEAWGHGYTVAESWQHGATAQASKDPTAIGAAVLDAVKLSRKNAGIELGTWLDP